MSSNGHVIEGVTQGSFPGVEVSHKHGKCVRVVTLGLNPQQFYLNLSKCAITEYPISADLCARSTPSPVWAGSSVVLDSTAVHF